MTLQEDQLRYTRAAHAMQSGVKMMQNYEHPELVIPDDKFEASDSPKHLRVGVNAAMVDHGGLTNLLISKGIITMAEYFKFAADTMEQEVHNYEKRIKDEIGTEVKLL